VITEAELKKRARELRNNPTEWEIWLWRHISNSQLAAYKFRRQHVIYPYICDFFCPSKGLVVEIDGDTHDAAYDARRDVNLAKKGFETIRVTNFEVRENIDGVLMVIEARLRARAARWHGGPHPNPSPKGEGLKT
jgi:very-short-patch-repair endonuclease